MPQRWHDDRAGRGGDKMDVHGGVMRGGGSKTCSISSNSNSANDHRRQHQNLNPEMALHQSTTHSMIPCRRQHHVQATAHRISHASALAQSSFNLHPTNHSKDHTQQHHRNHTRQHSPDVFVHAASTMPQRWHVVRAGGRVKHRRVRREYFNK